MKKESWLYESASRNIDIPLKKAMVSVYVYLVMVEGYAYTRPFASHSPQYFCSFQKSVKHVNNEMLKKANGKKIHAQYCTY